MLFLSSSASNVKVLYTFLASSPITTSNVAACTSLACFVNWVAVENSVNSLFQVFHPCQALPDVSRGFGGGNIVDGRGAGGVVISAGHRCHHVSGPAVG